MYSCQLKTSSKGGDERDSDSIAKMEALAVNPDTSYASADKLEYKIEVLDTLHSGTIGDYHDMYKDAAGILTFRGNSERNAMVFDIDKQPDSLLVEWTFRTDACYKDTGYGRWGGGTGWTGQPLYVEWTQEQDAEFKNKLKVKTPESSAKEIVIASLCGNVYFIDYETGKPSRKHINVYHPVKGTPMLDPTLNGLLYVGHGVRMNKEVACGQVLIDLKTNTLKSVFPHDSKAWRGWNAYDSSPVRVGQFVFRPSENGTLYKWLITDDGPKLHSTMKYRVKGCGAPGMEASMSVWRNYGYVNDNHGNVICVNLDNLKIVWRYDNHDDSDCTPVVSHEGERTYIYTGCEVDRSSVDGMCRFVKLDAMTGELIWENKKQSRKSFLGEKHFDGGYYSTPLLGEGKCKDILFVNRVLNNRGQNGELVAMEKATGKELYTVPTRVYAWSSPIGFNSKDGKFTVFTCDTGGFVYLIDGETGKLLYRKLVGANFESSPIYAGNSIIIGSRGTDIFRIVLGNK